jgi:hypothetical protein
MNLATALRQSQEIGFFIQKQREEILAALEAYVLTCEQRGTALTLHGFQRATGVTYYRIRSLFGTWYALKCEHHFHRSRQFRRRR